MSISIMENLEVYVILQDIHKSIRFSFRNSIRNNSLLFGYYAAQTAYTSLQIQFNIL
jgi:hypothetical protein